jgi:uncharacterized repeat protein (TIGR02543 family)
LFGLAIKTARNISVGVVLAMLFALLSPSLGSWNFSQPASAASVNFSGSYLNFDASTMVVLNGDSSSATVGNTFLYPSAGVIDGVSVDVTVEIVASTATGTPSFVWDEASSSQFNGVTLNQAQKDLIILNMGSGGERDVVFRYKFWETGTVVFANSQVSGISVELRNLLINTYDLDNDQWVAFSSFQRYQVNNTSPVAVSLIPNTTLVKFLGPNGNYSGDDSFTLGRARVIYDNVSSVDMRIFAPGGSLYGIQFGAGVAWSSAATFGNSFNLAPTSSNVTKYVVPGTPAVVSLPDFGNYSDGDSNPFFDVKFEATADLANLSYFDGTSTISPSAGSTISADAVRSGGLSFLIPVGSPAPATISFRVGDGLTYSAVAYSLSLAIASQTQVITFPESPLPIAPGSGAFSSSATTSAPLTVTLTSNTPNVCTIAPNGTDIVPVLTSVRSACSVTATQAGNSTYASATPVTRTFYFSNNAITFPQPSNQVYTASYAISSSAVASSSLPVTLISLTPSVCTVSGLDIQTVATGSCSVRAESAGGTSGGITYLAPFPVIRTFAITSGATFNLSYDSNTGIGSAPSNQTGVTTVTVGTGSLTKSGFNFVGWNANNTGSGTDYATGSSVTLTSNLTLYAKWVATVTFDSQGGSNVTSQQYVFGQSGLTLPTPTKAGNTFAGWSTTPTGSVLSGAYSSGSATLYAIWTAGSNGGSTAPAGPEIISITPNVVPTGGGQLIQVVGKRLGAGEGVTIGGVKVPLVNSSTTGFSFVMPALAAQSWDMQYSYDGGARLTYLSAIKVVAPTVNNGNAGQVKPQPRPWSAIGIASKFAPGSPVINAAVRAEVDAMLRKYARFATTIECTGFTMGPTVLRVDAKLSSDRAANVCRLIKQLRPKLTVISTQGRQELRLGGEIRRVEVLFKR